MFESKQLNSRDLWTACALSGKLLRDPIVSDYKGRLYNKESILEYLLTPEKFGASQRAKVTYITGIKDIVELKITRESKSQTWICPLTEKDIVKESASQRFVYIAECGHLMTEKAIRQMTMVDNAKDHGNGTANGSSAESSLNHGDRDNKKEYCPVCDTEYIPVNLVTVNPSIPELVKKNEDRMKLLAELGLTHSLKPKKKKEKEKKKQKSSTEKKRKSLTTSDDVPAKKTKVPVDT
ncbi:hypothetical protein AWJ20_4651 [Sugiyamaella lignohabitans]|uniref:Replication termination factor 2 n=1 Tax=Sugiyamaella lignohabitans TaxID=796027 RepID=A0A167E6J2_9ASCO|nr:uncharacterized protein AWJ20_4651 [Sugiyamaella lignohabitans]ANB13708.1 hypothetical protein AWJ20_4651 [Sugiyamaella lignohabitans]